MQQQQQQSITSQMQRGSSAKHARSKSTTTPQNFMQQPQAQQLQHQHQPQQDQLYLTSSRQTNQYSQVQPQAPQFGTQQTYASNQPSSKTHQPAVQPKRTLRPMDLNNCSSIPSDQLLRKCATPLEKDGQKKQTAARPTSKDQQRKSNKININSPERYYSAQQSRTINHKLEANQQAKQSQGVKLVATGGSSTSKNTSGVNAVRTSQQGKLNCSMNSGSLNQTNNVSSSKAETKELMQLMNQIPTSQQNPRKTSSMSSKNVPLPKNSYGNSQNIYENYNQFGNYGTPSSATNQGSQEYYKCSTDNIIMPKTQTRQQRTNKSMHQSSSSNSTQPQALLQFPAMQNLQYNPYSYLQQGTHMQQQQQHANAHLHPQQQQQLQLHQGSRPHHNPRSSSNYGHMNFNLPPNEVSGDDSSLFIPGNPHNPLQQNIPNMMLSLSFNQDEDYLRHSQKHPVSTLQKKKNILSTQTQQQQQVNALQIAAYKNEKAFESLQKGKQSFKDNNIEEALKHFQEALKEEPMLLESQYLLGVCYLSSTQYQKAVEEFCDLLEKNEHYKRNVYLLIAIAYKKTNVINAAIHILGKAIASYPKYYDAYIYRGKLQVKMKRFDKAISDFDIAISLNNSCGLGYMGKADCLRFMCKFDKAIQLYTSALEKEEIIAKVAILKRAITYIEAKLYDEAKTDLNQV